MKQSPTGELTTFHEPEFPNGAWPPPNEPPCGYLGMGLLCQQIGFSGASVIGLAVAVVLSAIIMIFSVMLVWGVFVPLFEMDLVIDFLQIASTWAAVQL